MESKFKTLMRHKGLLHDMPAVKLAQLQGEILSLFMASNSHHNATMSDFASTVLPAIHFNQFRIYRDSHRPIGWVTWAFMSEEDANSYIVGNFDFKISTWKSGEQLWFIDFIAPFGHAVKIVDDLKRNVFPDHIGFAPEVSNFDGAKRVRKFYGVNIRGVGKNDDHLDFLNSITT